MTYRGRFAPSPTGRLHAGSLVAALGSWLCARHAGGEWLLRVEDIDPPREVPGAAETILAALPQFGLTADAAPVYQSQRLSAYDAAFAELQSRGLVFPCWCSRSDLAPFGGLHRDGACVAAPDPQRSPAWRARVPNIEIAFDDALQGPQRQNLREACGDFVIRRVEGLYSYQLACVVDDAWQGITDVVRGSDLLDSTARQIWLQQSLGLRAPTYLHLPLVLGSDGRKLSKSDAALPVDPKAPMPALRQALRFLGLEPAKNCANPQDLLQDGLMRFDPRALPQHPAARVV